MAGYLSGDMLNNFAIAGAKAILIDRDLKGVLAFEDQPDACYRYLMLTYLFNEYFIAPLEETHPNFAPIAAEVQYAVQTDSMDCMDICRDILFDKCVELCADDESLQCDINFNIMMAVLLGNCYSKEICEEYQGAFLSKIEQCSGVEGFIPSTLLSSALWGGNYENFRQLATDRYFELKAQGFGSGIGKPDWECICEYIYNRPGEWGRDGYLEDAEKWNHEPPRNQTAEQTPSQEKTQWFNRFCRGPLDRLAAYLKRKGYKDSPYHDEKRSPGA